ncbi:MAG: hypothetical protein CTY31_02195 [Hyphomicrobium sp.]|nr:MAG: hypothetical protein CTY39_00465 [Hyphomicrobium sp.]PPD01586.1 MAG: hypothetical protein CTY31_02195 [Hyphomicrobium sp.]
MHSQSTSSLRLPENSVGSTPQLKPLCVDLDGTLLKTDALVEGILAIISSPGALVKIPQLLVTTRASLKQRVAELSNLDPALLPYNRDVLDYVDREKRRGRPIVLVTAADQRIAHAISDHLGIFDEVIASDGNRNLKGEEKASELVRRYGRQGYDYVGNDRTDLPAWREADSIIMVDTSTSVASAARAAGNIAAEFCHDSSFVKSALRAMRPHQWVKNVLVFVPLLAAQSLTDASGFLGALMMFVAFCASASAIYLINDLLDLAADRSHPHKKNRPFASGTLALTSGAVLATALLGLGIALSVATGSVAILLAYATISLAYSVALKCYPLLDVFILALLYTLRIIAGGIASGHLVTLWLLAFSGFTFLSLALVKRTGELMLLQSSAVAGANLRRGYEPADIGSLQMFGVASAFASSVVLALFVNRVAELQQYRSPEILWGLVPLILFWQLRLWLSTQRGHMHDDPIVYAARDWVSWLVAIGACILLLLASQNVRLW